MVRISVEVSSGAARFRVSVLARSIERAMEIVRGQNPGKSCKMRFPTDPERVLVKDPVARVGLIEGEQPGLRAA
jgi:hypothetical protein